MKITVILFIAAGLLFLSGCLVEGNYPHGKYLANNSDTLTFAHGNIFYGTEYLEFSQQTVELSGMYMVVGNEVTLEYKFIGFVRRFEISNMGRTLTELNNGNKGMQFNHQVKVGS